MNSRIMSSKVSLRKQYYFVFHNTIIPYNDIITLYYLPERLGGEPYVMHGSEVGLLLMKPMEKLT
jgi:hypothetical protein